VKLKCFLFVTLNEDVENGKLFKFYFISSRTESKQDKNSTSRKRRRVSECEKERIEIEVNSVIKMQ